MAMAQAEVEMELMTDLFNAYHTIDIKRGPMPFIMLNTCHQKCISPKYQDSELNKGEMVCTDRCVAKYMSIFQTIGKKLQATSQQEINQ